MALTTTQVNTAFLAALARPAEGSAATWGAGSLNLDSLLNNIFIAENTDDFVESLYTEFLGRASDAEGKAFWNSLLATTSKEAVLAQFKAAILAAGQADPSNADYQGLIATNKAFVQALYTNLLGREADAEGLEFWANVLTSGTSRGDLLAQFTAAAMASGADNDDYQAITAKLAVADAFSAKFSAFSSNVTADEKKAALDQLKAMMEGVVAGSTVEDVQEEINQIAGNYQNRTSQVFTKADDDLDASEATAATTFRGTVNLIDPAKGTIQDTDKVTGNTDFDDTLVVNVTSDSTHKLLDLDGNYLPTGISDIEKLIVNNGSANVSGTLNGVNFGKSVSITGTGDVNLNVTGGLENLSVSSATKGDVAIDVNSALGSYTGGNAGESVTVASTGSIKKASLGAGDDTLVINGLNAVLAGGTIDLGAGNDDLVINSNITVAANEEKITLDGGAGSKDTLTLNNGVDLSGVKSIKGFETIDATNAIISAEAANGLKAKFVNGSNLVVSGDAKATTSINLSGLSVDKNESATVALNGLTKETITLSKDKGITESIEIFNPDVKGNEQVSVTIKNFAKGDTADKLVVASGSNVVALDLAKADKIDPSKATQALKYIQEKATDLLQAGINYVAINTANGKASYVWKVEGATATRDDITLVANVDKALTANDFTGGGTPAPTPTPGEPTGLVFDGIDRYIAEVKANEKTTLSISEEQAQYSGDATSIVITGYDKSVVGFDKTIKNATAAESVIIGTSVQGANIELDGTNLGSLASLTTVKVGGAGNATITLNETMATLTNVNLGVGNDTLNLTEGFSGGTIAIDAGAGADTINLTGLIANNIGASLTINGGSGSDTLILDAEIYGTKINSITNVETIVGVEKTVEKALKTSTINLKAISNVTSTTEYTAKEVEIDGKIVLVADSGATKVNTTALTDDNKDGAVVTIDLSGITTASSVTEIKGSASVNEIANIGNKTFTNAGATFAGIDAILGNGSTAEVKADVFGNNSTIKAIDGQLKVTYAKDLDLSKVVNGEAKLTLDTVKASGATNETLKLTSAAGIEETVKLDAAVSGSGDIIIVGATKGDKVNITAIASDGFATEKVTEKASALLAKNGQAFYIDLDAVKVKSVSDAASIQFGDVMTDQSTGNYTGAAVVQLKDGIAIYAVDDKSNSGGSLDLIAVVNDVTSATGSLAGNLVIGNL